MAKKSNKVSYNPIKDITEDWGIDSRNNLPYSGESVQAFIKKTLNAKAGYLKISERREADGNFHIRNFASEKDYKLWFNDPTTYESLVLQDEILPDTHEQGVSYVVGLSTTTNQQLLVSTDDTMSLQLKFTSQMYNPINQSTEDTGESGTLTIERRVSNDGTWTKVKTVQLNSVPYNSNNYTTIDIWDIIETGNQQIRCIVRGNSSNESSKHITFFSVIKTKLALKFANSWQNPIKNNVMILSYYVQGAVAKTLHLKIYDVEGVNSREYSYPLGNTVYTETPISFNFTDEVTDTVKLLKHGVHKIEAWLTVDGGTLTSNKVYSQVMVANNPTDNNIFVTINSISNEVDNWVDSTLFQYSVYNPKAINTTLLFNITNSDGSVSYYKNKVSNIPNNTVNNFITTFEIESKYKKINSYVNITDELNTKLINPFEITIKNSYNFSSISGAAFILNPRLRNNNEHPNTIINSVDNSTVNSKFTNFAFTNDGWIIDENGIRCLRIPAGRKLEIDYESFSDFIGTSQNINSLTLEFDFKTYHVNDENTPILQMCSYLPNGNPLGFEMKPMEAVFMTTNKQVRRDQDIMFQEGVRTHVAVNIIYNIAQSVMNYIRIFINGIINREIEYLSNDNFVGFISGNQTSQGIRIGSDGADIDIYNLRVYKKEMSTTDIIQNYIYCLPTLKDKLDFKNTNDILGDSGNISYSKSFDKYNCLIWTGKVPSYVNKSAIDNGGTLQIHMPGDKVHSGVINNMGIKGQGSSSKGYWKWNHQYKFNKDSQFISEDESVKQAAYRLKDGVPAATKLVSKLNWASSMQSHKMGGTNAYNDLWKAIIGGNDITSTKGFEDARVAIVEKPFLYFIKETADSEPVFYGIVTFGPGKGDKPTFGYDNKQFPDFLMLEGSDNGKPLTEMRVPWMDDEVTYSAEEEAYIYNGEVSWDYDLGNQDKLDFFKRAFNFVFTHNTNIAPHAGNLTALLNDNNLNKNKQYWITEAEGNYKVYDLFRWDYITNTWVSASANKIGNSYDRFNINVQCNNIASGSDYNNINNLFISERLKQVREKLSQYFNLNDLFFTMMEMKKLGASDNRCKNIYPYLDPKSHLIRWYQDDVDTILLTDNVGRKNKPYYVEEHDVDADGNNYWNGESHVLFNIVEEAFPDELRIMMKTILITMAKIGGSVTGFMEKYFFSTQKYIPAVAYNETARLLYEEASKAVAKGTYSNATAPITQSLGDQLQAEKQWWKMREIYLSSYAGYGEFDVRGNGSLMFRSIKNTDGSNPTYSFTLVPSIWLYVQGGVGQTMFYGQGKTRPQRVKAGETYILNGLSADGNTDVFINGANYYKSFGPFGDKSLGEAFQLFGERLEEFVVDNSTVTEFRPNSMTINCPSLKKITLNRVPTLKGSLDLLKSNILEEFKSVDTNLTSVLFTKTPTIKKITLPATISSLILNDLINLESTNLIFTDYSNLSVIQITNCPKIDLLNILENAEISGASLDKVVAYDINWTTLNLSLINKLAVNKATLTGKINLGNSILTSAHKLNMVKAWGNIDNTSNNLYIKYNIIPVDNVQLKDGNYFDTPGKYKVEVIFSPNNSNNITDIRWTINQNKWAVIDSSTGEISVVNTGNSTDNPLPEAIVTCSVTKIGGGVISSSVKVHFYTKEAELGDIVYADGSYSSVYNPSKTPIGVCFYINPEDKTDRRMVAFTSFNGMLTMINDPVTGIKNLTLKDRPSYDPYVILDMPVVTTAGCYDVTSNQYRQPNTTDSEGFNVYPESTGVGQIIKKKIIFSQGLGQFKQGDYISYGQYNTLLTIRHRNVILSDSNVNLPIPQAGVDSELNVLNKYISDVVSKNNVYYAEIYYPACSYCYAYEPTVKPGETLNNKFREHNWWLPSVGELMRIIYYCWKGNNDTDPNAVFTNAIKSGLFNLNIEHTWASTMVFEGISSGINGQTWVVSPYQTKICIPVTSF